MGCSRDTRGYSQDSVVGRESSKNNRSLWDEHDELQMC